MTTLREAGLAVLRDSGPPLLTAKDLVAAVKDRYKLKLSETYAYDLRKQFVRDLKKAGANGPVATVEVEATQPSVKVFEAPSRPPRTSRTWTPPWNR